MCCTSAPSKLALFESKALDQKDITAETTVNYLWFDDRDYERLGARIKCCPAIKKEKSRLRLLKGVASGVIDTIATDHAPHLLKDKEGDALTAASGIPSIQHSLPMMLELAKRVISRVNRLLKKCVIIQLVYLELKTRIYSEGYYADLVIVSPNTPYTVEGKIFIISVAGLRLKERNFHIK